MKRLGEILVDRGAITKEQLQSALTACRRHGGRLGTWLVRLGYLKENALLSALSEQSHSPSATALDLAGASGEVRGLVPASFAKRHMVVAFARDARGLDVAMVNPKDLVLLDEVASLTGLAVRPHVATEAALAAALALPLASPSAASSASAAPAPRRIARSWRQFWRMESSGAELAAIMQSDSGSVQISPAHAEFPSLDPIGTDHADVVDTDLDELAESLRHSNRRDDIARHLQRHLLRLASRVALFSLHKGQVMGWSAAGDGIVPEDFQTLMLPIDRPSVFLNLTKGLDMHLGKLGPGEGNDLILQVLGTPTPEEAVVLPLKVRGKTAAFLWVDAGEHPASEISLAVVREAARLGGIALEVLVLRQKIKATSRLTGISESD